MSRRTLVFIAALGLAPGLGACQPPAFSAPEQLGGHEVSADELNRGFRVYRSYCASCHGQTGAGDGPAAASIVPKPRDFRAGIFRYTSVPSGALPTDADLLRTLERGVPGTQMAAWQGISPESRQAVVDFLKTLSPRWKDEAQGEPVALPDDPWGGATAAAIAYGSAVYHGQAACNQCHPSYGQPRPTTLPPPSASDFLARRLRGGDTPRDIARAIAVGIGGTPMPAYHEKLDARMLWGVSYFVRDVARSRGTPKAKRLESASVQPPALR